jgi:hypothetical protein
MHEIIRKHTRGIHDVFMNPVRGAAIVTAVLMFGNYGYIPERPNDKYHINAIYSNLEDVKKAQELYDSRYRN